MNIVEHNKAAWNNEVKTGNGGTVSATTEDVLNAKKGSYGYKFSTNGHYPQEWIDHAKGKKILCLAAGGGQQGPVFAAIGADVTVFDNSPLQLKQDEMVAKRDNLVIHLEQGDMCDLSRFDDESFDMIYHGFANHFIPDLSCLWKECYRVLKHGGILLATFWNPVNYIFDADVWDHEKKLLVKYSIPYSDLSSLPKERLDRLIADGEPIEFGHSLQSQIGGQIQAGFVINGFFEDSLLDDYLTEYMNTVISTRAVKM